MAEWKSRREKRDFVLMDETALLRISPDYMCF